jgi:2-polyprenyl-3-methyl-5-hydroxy-6-metoxy-1,4-benzoquinol methylase
VTTKEPETAYARRTIFSHNPLARLSHRTRFAQAIAAICKHLPSDGSLLDFGCARGELLARVREQFPGARLYGLDPFQPDGSGYVHLSDVAECCGLSFDAITAFEVLEHLGPEASETFFALVREHLASGGVCIVSVPNMLGPALMPKLLHAALTGGSALGYSVRSALGATLFLKSPPRLAPNRSGTMRHKGFDWRLTRARIAHEFDIVSETVTPFPRLWWGFNSQWFCTFRLR